MTIKFIIFDLDNTLLCNKTRILFKDAKIILQQLKLKGYKIGLASYNAYADRLLDKHNISQYFDYIMYEDARLLSILDKFDFKQQMLTNLISQAGVKKEEILFFDDQQTNLDTALKIGIKTCKADVDVGITLEMFENHGIEICASN